MAIYELSATQIRRIEETTFDEAGLKERCDLQRLLRSHIDVIAPGVLVIAEEFCDWVLRFNQGEAMEVMTRDGVATADMGASRAVGSN